VQCSSELVQSSTGVHTMFTKMNEEEELDALPKMILDYDITIPATLDPCLQ